MLILIAGLPGTGKTTIARAFANLTGATHLNSDTIRRELGLMGQYRPEDKEKVYNTLLLQTREALLRKETVVVDSTFYKEMIREPFRVLAADCGVPLRWVEIQASEQALRQRLSQPRPDSEADFQVYQNIRNQFEPLSEDRLTLQSEIETPESAAIRIQQYLGI